MRERFRGDSCGESQPLILYVVYLQVGAVILAAFCRTRSIHDREKDSSPLLQH